MSRTATLVSGFPRVGSRDGARGCRAKPAMDGRRPSQGRKP